ncbi:hypothetical protein M595_6019 [Lyngbya aestuarii BL J]|uniref:Uncharacterized protein n=1 Tax=Lyngbya aestuarii BL J TaxID=1348334 RepID=U7QA37_9CYAN|nr:hypothetical protein M595_6019 [Lyngbya aestuarii BL J]
MGTGFGGDRSSETLRDMCTHTLRDRSLRDNNIGFVGELESF